MNPWLETIGVILVALSGVGLGLLFSRFRRSYWLLGYFLPLSLIFVLIVGRCVNWLGFVEPFSYIVAGRMKFVILSLAVSMGLTTPLSRLPRRFERVFICSLMAVVVGWFSVLPFLVPALLRERLANLKNLINSDGVCFQTTDYTCAPAAAVTALGKLGISAQEGELAVLSHTSPVAGTLPGCLEKALQNRYGTQGLECRYRYFDSVAQLRNAGITVAMVRDAFLSDHCVAVLEVSDRLVVVADPVAGKQWMSYDQFEKIWRFTGIVLRRDGSHSI